MMFLFILSIVIGVFVLAMAEALHARGENDQEGLRIVKGVVVGIPLVLGIILLKPPLFVVAIAIVVFKCLFSAKIKAIIK